MHDALMIYSFSIRISLDVKRDDKVTDYWDRTDLNCNLKFFRDFPNLSHQGTTYSGIPPVQMLAYRFWLRESYLLLECKFKHRLKL